MPTSLNLKHIEQILVKWSTYRMLCVQLHHSQLDIGLECEAPSGRITVHEVLQEN